MKSKTAVQFAKTHVDLGLGYVANKMEKKKNLAIGLH